MKVIVLSIRDPWKLTDGGTLRTRAFINAFKNLGHDVACLFPSEQRPLQGGETMRSVASPGLTLGTRNWPGWIRRFKRRLLPLPTQRGARSAGLREELQTLAPVDLLLVTALSQAPYCRYVPNSALWLDFFDLWSEFATRELARRRGVSHWTTKLQIQHLSRLEKKYVGMAHVVSAAGWTDAQVLSDRTNRVVSWVPTPLDQPLTHRSIPSAASTRPIRVAGFLANLEYPPNQDGWELLRCVWLPRLREIGWEVLVAGYGTDKLPHVQNVQFLGRLESVDAFYASIDVSLAPIRLGGGIKVKVLESLLRGCPVVATPFALEGFPPDLRRHMFIVNPEDPDFSVLRKGPPSTDPGLPHSLKPFGHGRFARTLADMLQLAKRSSSSPLDSHT